MKRILIAIGAFMATALMIYAAGEINSVITLKVTKGTLNFTRAVNITTNMNGAQLVAGFTQLVNTNTVGTALGLDNVTTNGVFWFSNLNTSNYIEIGVQDANTNFLALLRINPGESWSGRLAQGITPYARANVDSVILEKIIVEN